MPYQIDILEAENEFRESQFKQPVGNIMPPPNKMPPPSKMTASIILQNGAKAIASRASVRDLDDERSMDKAVEAFNTLFGKDLTETQGWQFMVILKMSRSSQGDFHMDDYEDQASYSALAGECGSYANNNGINKKRVV